MNAAPPVRAAGAHIRRVPGHLAGWRLGHHHRPDSMIMHGHSDSTLNRHGVRLGSTETYDAVPQILDSLIAGLDEAGGGN